MPKWSRIEYRAILRYNYERGLNVEQCLEEMTPIFGDDCPSRATVFRWYNQFQRGVYILEDDPRPGRPAEVVVPENVASIKKLISEDTRITYRQIELLLKIGAPSVHSILHDHLYLKKVCTVWVPQVLSEEDKARRVDWCKEMIKTYECGSSQDVYSIVTGGEICLCAYDVPSKSKTKVWFFEDDIPTTVKLQSRSMKKKIIAVFFGKRGIIERVVLDTKKKKSPNWYTEHSLPQLIQSLKNLRPKEDISAWRFHHNNAPAFNEDDTQRFLKESGLTLLVHPPNSPDLAPCEFGVFPYVSKQIKGHRFSDDSELIDAWDQASANIEQEEWVQIFNNWFIRMQKCIELEGEYIEKKI